MSDAFKYTPGHLRRMGHYRRAMPYQEKPKYGYVPPDLREGGGACCGWGFSTLCGVLLVMLLIVTAGVVIVYPTAHHTVRHRIEAHMSGTPLSEQGTPAPGLPQADIERDTALLQNEQTRLLDPDEQYAKKQLFERNQFNQFISDKLPLTRAFPDARDPGCLELRYYPTWALPTTSVVIIFHNEAISVLMRTVRSVLDRSPSSLLHEIILVDDASPGEWTKEPMVAAMKALNSDKVRLLRLDQRNGLIRAKVHGAEHATGDVLIFLDSHCECNPGWLIPLLDRIKRDRKTVAMPVIDVIDDKTWDYGGGGTPIQRGAFSWWLVFTWLDMTNREQARRAKKQEHGMLQPFASPTMAGGLFAMDRKYFFESGGYDMGMDVWGGENLEMSFRLWMCGGRLEIVPCSRVGHVFRAKAPYKYEKDPSVTIGINLNRVADVWMDQYAELYYDRANSRQYGTGGSIEERVKLRKDMKCRSFQWYLETVFPDQFVPLAANILAQGVLYNPITNRCLMAGDENDSNEVTTMMVTTLAECDFGSQEQIWHWTKKPRHSLRYEGIYGGRCVGFVDVENLNAAPDMRECAPRGHGEEEWTYSAINQLTHLTTGFCLEAEHVVRQGKPHVIPVMRECRRGNPRQKWYFGYFSPYGRDEAKDMMKRGGWLDKDGETPLVKSEE